MAFAVDSNGKFYVIDDDVLKEHGVKVDKLQFGDVSQKPEADVEGQSWEQCKWGAWLDCG
jgi:hypothetical protein